MPARAALKAFVTANVCKLALTESGIVSLEQEVQAGYQQEELEFHTTVRNAESVLEMYHQDCADHDDDDDQAAQTGQDFPRQNGATDKRGSRADLAKRNKPCDWQRQTRTLRETVRWKFSYAVIDERRSN
jgi:hypothetical protein